MRFVFRVLCDAFMRFLQDDGWAIASHIALSILMSLFPFLIFVTALAGSYIVWKINVGKTLHIIGSASPSWLGLSAFLMLITVAPQLRLTLA